MTHSTQLDDAYAAYKAGTLDRDSLVVAIHGYLKRVLRILLMDNSTLPFDDTEDLAMDALIRASSAMDTTTLTARFSTWISTIAHNVMLDSVQERARLAECCIDEAATVPAPDVYGDILRRQRLSEVFELLDPLEQEILSLWLQGFKKAEIVNLTGVPRATVTRKLSTIAEHAKTELNPC